MYKNLLFPLALAYSIFILLFASSLFLSLFHSLFLSLFSLSTFSLFFFFPHTVPIHGRHLSPNLFQLSESFLPLLLFHLSALMDASTYVHVRALEHERA